MVYHKVVACSNEFYLVHSFRYNEDKNEDGEWYLDAKNSLFEKDSNQLSEVGILYNSL